MDIYVDATTLIALGNVGELELLLNFDGDFLIPQAVFREITTEPVESNIKHLLHQQEAYLSPPQNPDAFEEAAEILDEDEDTGDLALIAKAIWKPEYHGPIGVVSDDRRVRTVAESLGATVTGTIGVVVRAVHEGMDHDEAKELVRRLDSQGLHMTGELRDEAYRLVDEAAEKRDDD